VHTIADIIRFRLLMIAAGYEDGNDATSRFYSSGRGSDRGASEIFSPRLRGRAFFLAAAPVAICWD
jgi:hypothetical protein